MFQCNTSNIQPHSNTHQTLCALKHTVYVSSVRVSPCCHIIYRVATATKLGKSHCLYVPLEARFKVKHNSSIVNTQRESVWSHFTHDVRQFAEEVEEEGRG